MASTNGIMGFRYYTDYNATKAGVIELTKSMALELAPKVRVCAVAPGYVMTPMQRAEYTDEMFDELNRETSARRHAQPEEVAALFAFLASDDASYITGHVYTIDGARDRGRAGQPMRIRTIVPTVLVLGLLCAAQEQPGKLVLRAYHGSTGPFGGEKGASCLMLYSDGRIVQTFSSTAAMGVQDEHGKVTHPEKK